VSAIRLIDKPECPFCWRVRMAAALQGRAVDHLDREDPEVMAEWERLSPSRTVPVLIDGGLVLTDSGPMLEYLSETGTPLLPDTPRQRAEARSWVAYADNPLGRAVREVVFEKRAKPESEWDQERIVEGEKGFVAALPDLEEWLDKQEYLVGNQPTLAECALLPRLALAAAYDLPIPDAYPHLQAWLERLMSRLEILATAPAVVQERFGQRTA
jgi:glutathione S-transferase